jgi:hypothetical protein
MISDPGLMVLVGTPIGMNIFIMIVGPILMSMQHGLDPCSRGLHYLMPCP